MSGASYRPAPLLVAVLRFVAEFMTPASGTRLGPYEIVSALGVGGMGEVYRARDTRLERDVAIKILPEIIAQSLKSGERRVLLNGGADARYLPTGHIVYAFGGTLFAVPFNLRNLAVSGGAVPVLEGVLRPVPQSPGTGSAQFGASETGTLMYI